MAYITPNSTIYLYNNIELDNSYKDTLYFSDVQEQNAYFDVTKPYKFAFIQQMYQRTNKGTLRIEKNAELLYDCNYMRFVNPRTVNGVTYAKWYYAFITDWEYINENVTEITYEIDVMQSYFFDVVIEPSFVVRQHPLTDNKHENLLMEDLNYGTDYVVSGSRNYPLTPDTIVVFTLKPSAVSDIPHGSIINNMPTPLAVKVFKGIDLSATIGQYYQWLNDASFVSPAQVAENIVAVYLLPSIIASDGQTSLIPDGAGDGNGEADLGHNYVGRQPVGGYFLLDPEPATIDGYAPHNWKLFNYPYNFLAVSNHLGDVVQYKYELFSGVNPRLAVMGAVIPTPAFMCYPENYRGVAEDIDSGLKIGEFPTLPVTINGYQQWMLHNSYKMAMAGLSAGIGLAAGIGNLALTPVIGQMGGNAMAKDMLFEPEVQPFVNSINHFSQTSLLSQAGLMRSFGRGVRDLSHFAGNVASIFGSMGDATMQANGSSGMAGGNGLLVGANKYEFVQYQMQIRRYEAEKLDTFFDMFGYSMNKVMDINRNSRPVFNYVKTEGCCIIQKQTATVSTGATAQVISELQSIYDNGITFWKPYSGFNIGDYSFACRDANSLHPQS